MAVSAEAIIALIALFVACVPGIRFALNNRNRIRQWWSQEKDSGEIFWVRLSIRFGNLQISVMQHITGERIMKMTHQTLPLAFPMRSANLIFRPVA
jgi:hypothetical protein